MKKKIMTSNLFIILMLVVWLAPAYYFLLHDNFLHCSIAAIIQMTHQLAPTAHLFVVSFLPIYIASIIFGTALFALYFTSSLQRQLLTENLPHLERKPIAQPKASQMNILS